MATRTRKKKSDYGSVYKGHPGQWSWLFHRVTGVAIILFLFAHVVDTAVIGWGPEAYNRVIAAYENPYRAAARTRARRRGAVPLVQRDQDHADRLLPARS